MPSSRKVASPSARATLSASSSAANTTTARVSMPRAAAEQRQLASRSVTPPLIAITTTVPPPCRAALASVGRSAWLIASSRASSAASIASGLSPLAVDERGLGGTGDHTCVRYRAHISYLPLPTTPPVVASAICRASAADTPAAAAAAPRFVTLVSRGAAPSCHTCRITWCRPGCFVSSTTTQFSLCSFTSTTASSSQPCARSVRSVAEPSGGSGRLPSRCACASSRPALRLPGLRGGKPAKNCAKTSVELSVVAALNPRMPLRGLG